MITNRHLTGPKQRVVLLFLSACYTAFFQWMYIYYLYPTWAYLGFDYNPPPNRYLLLAWLLSLFPILWMPLNLVRPSQLAYWALYITVLIPSMFAPLYMGLNSLNEIAIMMAVLFVGFAITGFSYFLPLLNFRRPNIPSRLFWQIVGGLSIGLAVWMVVVFRHHIRIVNFSDVADLREAANDVAEGSNVNYAFMTLTGAINPFLMGCGLYYRRWGLFAAGMLGQFLVYSVGGTKGSVVSVLFITGIYFLLKNGSQHFALKFSGAMLALMAGLCAWYYLVGYLPGTLLTVALFVVLNRTLSINGVLTAQYFDFFQKNPLTYYTHIKGINWLWSYPYKYPIGQEIGLAYAGTTDLDSTAHFWATDGIGGFGLPGIILVSVLCALVFWFLDSASRRQDPRLAALVTTYSAYNLANISLFTTSLSGGLGLLILFLYWMPRPSAASLLSSTESQRRKAAASRQISAAPGGG
jgi:hypothetical protein